MNTFMSTAALALTLVGASATFAAADAHGDVLDMTCAEFTAFEGIEQQTKLVELVAASDEITSDDLMAGDVAVLCNGRDEDTVGLVLDQIESE